MAPRFSRYDDFWKFYLEQHSKQGTKLLHALGVLIALGLALPGLAMGRPIFLFFALIAGYGLAWIGHFGIEKNLPATFGHPWWSLYSDFRMTFLILSGLLSRH